MDDFQWDGKLIRFLELMVDLFLIMAFYVIATVIVSTVSYKDLMQWDYFSMNFFANAVILFFGVLIFFRVYEISVTKRSYLSVMFRIAVSLFVVGFIMFMVTLMNMEYSLPRLAIILMLVIQLPALAIVKGTEYMFLKKVNVKTSLIFGPKKEVEMLAKKVLYDDNRFIHLKYLVYDDVSNGDVSKIFEYIDKVDYVYLTEGLPENKKDIIISYCFKIRKPFYLIPALYELSINKAHVTQISDALAYEIDGFGLSLEQRFLKRSFDLIVSFIIFVITSPIMLVTAITVKLYDRGPVLYKQERITKHNKKFILYKFRTMIPDAEKDTGPILADSNDNRITKIGKFLRATRIDELPQLINIIKGEMSIVGPRPEREHFIKQFIEENKDYQYRLHVKSGVTGLAQALGTYNTNFNEKLRFDIYYITNYSFLNDIFILLHTIRSIFDPKSAKGLSLEESLDQCLEAEGYHKLETDNQSIKIIVRK